MLCWSILSNKNILWHLFMLCGPLINTCSWSHWTQVFCFAFCDQFFAAIRWVYSIPVKISFIFFGPSYYIFLPKPKCLVCLIEIFQIVLWFLQKPPFNFWVLWPKKKKKEQTDFTDSCSLVWKCPVTVLKPPPQSIWKGKTAAWSFD